LEKQVRQVGGQTQQGRVVQLVFYKYLFNHFLSKMTCFACRRRYQFETTYVNSYWKKHFCDIKIDKSLRKKKCQKCSLILYSSHCEKGHKKLCNGQGHFGWYCEKCKHFTYKTENLTSQEIKKKHICGLTTCRICRQSTEPELEKTHLCPIRKEKASKFWPSLAFLNIEFCEFNSDDCCICFELKKKFKEETKLTWKEVFEHRLFPSLNCDEHKSTQAVYEPLIFSVNKESRSNRGLFTNFIISDICQSRNDPKVEYNYFSSLKNPNKFVPSKKISNTILGFKQKLNQENLTHKFISLLLDEHWTNTTFIILDEYSMKLVIII
jgi:hypothetical protein